MTQINATVTGDMVNAWLINNPPGKYMPRRAIECADGFKMSVQAGMNLYCTPPSDRGPWSTVEVGFPSQIEPLLWEYAQEPGNWTDTVYARVPVDLVAAVIEVHGGFNLQERAPK